MPPYDPRSVANSLLEAAWNFDLKVTHLSLQKVVYFLHAKFLTDTKQPFCKGYFEAWKHGPVHPQLWSAFKESGREAIRHHAYGLDVQTGIARKVDEIDDKSHLFLISTKGLELLTIPAHRLVGMSHLPGGPWDRVTKLPGGQREYGGRISQELILECRHSKVVSVSEPLETDEELYEQPPT